jgi:hypothetical protein
MFHDHKQFLVSAVPLRRESVLKWITGAVCLALIGLLAARGIWREPAGVSSYGALADAFINGRLFVGSCPEIDCAVFNGRTYIIFPPLPAVLLTPLVAVTGLAAFKGAVALAAVLVGIAL